MAMDAILKYEIGEEFPTNEQQFGESETMSNLHGQYYGERAHEHVAQQQQQQQQLSPEDEQHQTQLHSEAIQIQQQQQQRDQSVHHSSNLRASLPEGAIRQRPTHPDFAHLRQSNTTAPLAKPIHAESSRQSKQSFQTSLQNNHQHYTQAAVKRGYHQIEHGYVSNTQTSSSTALPPGMVANDSGASYYATQGLMNMPPHAPQNMDIFNSTYSAYNIQNNPLLATQSDGKSPKRYKKGEASLLFSPPFFKILPVPFQFAGMVSPNQKDAIAAQCYACGRIVRGNKSISSNFIKHMKRSHPEISKIYDTYKIFRIKAGIMPNIASLMNEQMQKHSIPEEATSATQDDVGDCSNDESNSYFDPTNMLDVTEMIEEDNHSENSENPEDTSLPVGEPPSELTNQNGSKECQEKEPAAQKEQERTAQDDPLTNEISNRLLENLKIIIDEKLKDFVKLSDIAKLTDDIKKVKVEKSDPANDDFKKQMDQLRQECMALRRTVQQSQAGKNRLQKELQMVDKMLHQKKIIIRHLKVDNTDKPEEAVKQLFKNKLGLADIGIENCSIIPSTRANAAMMAKKESIVVELQNSKDSKLVLRETHKLKDTGIFIEPEISPFQRKRKNKLMVLRRELLRRQPNLKVTVKNTTLVVNSSLFYWDDIDGLCHTRNDEAIELSGSQYLAFVTGVDLGEFVDVLKNYDVQLKE